MSMIARRTALQATRLPFRQFVTPARRGYAEAAANETAEKKDVLQKGAKKDPELYVGHPLKTCHQAHLKHIY